MSKKRGLSDYYGDIGCADSEYHTVNKVTNTVLSMFEYNTISILCRNLLQPDNSVWTQRNILLWAKMGIETYRYQMFVVLALTLVKIFEFSTFHEALIYK